MTRPVATRLLLFCIVITGLFTGCTRDPNVRKQKYFDSGEKYFAEGKYREAILQYSNAVQLDKNFAQAHYKLSEAYLKLGDPRRAFQELNRTVELAPDNYPAHTDIANLLLTQRDPAALKEAKAHLDILAEKAPNSPQTHEAWADYYAAQDNLASAMQEAQKAITLDPSRSESYLLLAIFQLRANLPAQAEANLKTAVDKDPKAMNAQLALGGFYQGHNRLGEAEQQYRHAIDIDPKNAAPRQALARLLMQEGKKDEAENFLQQTKKDLSDNPEGYRMLGDFYYATGNSDKALAEFASLYKDHPKDAPLRKNYIQLLIDKNQLSEASKLDNDVLKSNGHDVEGLIFKGEIQLRQNDTSAAAESLQDALRYDPENAIAHFQLGVAYARQQDTARAESEWRDAVRVQPNLVDAQNGLAMIEMSRGDYDSAVQSAQQIINAVPSAPDGYLLRSTAEMNQQKFTEAQHDAEEAMKRAPNSPDPFVRIGSIQFAQKNYSEAEKSFQQALDKGPSSTDGLSGLMHVYVAQKNYDKAIAAANMQIAKSPSNSNFYDLLGTALFEGKKDYSGAETALRKAVDLDKSNIDALQKLGKVEVQQHNIDQALALYLESAKNNPHEFGFYILAGNLYEAKQNWDQAKAMYQQALAISPNNALASNNLAYLILEQGGNVDVAMNMAQTARRAMPNSPNFADTLGWAYYHKGIYQSAINQFQEALKLNDKNGGSDDPVVHYHLGLAYQKANQMVLARQQLEKAAKLAPDNADVRKALAELRS